MTTGGSPGFQASSITRELAHFAATAAFESIPPDLVKWHAYDALDSVAVGLFGSSRPWITRATELWEEFGGAPHATVWGRALKLPVPIAVRANSHAQNAFEYDDTYVWRGYGLHVGNNVVPAAAAVAEYVGNVSGRDLLTAIVVGHEVGIRVRLGIISPRPGWNHTAICSTFGAAAAAGRLLGLETEAMTWALGSAGAYVGGMLTYPPSSMVKRLVNGRAAEGGTMAAMLAARGFSGIENVLEAEKGGFYTTFTNGFDLDAAVQGLGATYFSANVQPKRYPMITTAHAAIEAACRLVAQHDFGRDEISEITVHTNARSQLTTTGFEADTFSAAQMSLIFGIATAIRFGNVLPEALSETGLRDPELRALMAKITPVKEPRFEEIKKEAGGPAQVKVRLRNGRVLESPIVPDISRMTGPEIEDKARHVIGLVYDSQRADDIVDFFRTIEQRPSVAPLFPLLRSEG